MPELVNINHLISLICAGLFGAVIGVEREARDKGAGIRTHTLVSLGSCLFTLVSVDSMKLFQDSDPTRIAAQIVSGIGFLGGGAILQDRDKVHGLTTAATIWISAAIGMACGMSQLVSALLVTALTIFFLFVFRRISKSVRKVRSTWLLTITYPAEMPHVEFFNFENRLETLLQSLGFRILEFNEKSSDKIEIVVRGQGKLSVLTHEMDSFLPDNAEIDLREV
jgi:putative Mg2+ transporter-C (MgtC) family protein